MRDDEPRPSYHQLVSALSSLIAAMEWDHPGDLEDCPSCRAVSNARYVLAGSPDEDKKSDTAREY